MAAMAIFSYSQKEIELFPENCYICTASRTTIHSSSQQVHYNTTFYASPVVLVSVHHYYDRQVKNHIPPENNVITAWVEVGYYLNGLNETL